MTKISKYATLRNITLLIGRREEGLGIRSGIVLLTEGFWTGNAGDRLPLGPPSLMMSPQGVNMGTVMPELVRNRDEKYQVSTDDLRMSRVDVMVPESVLFSNADYWMQSGKGFAVDVQLTQMKKMAPFP